MPERESSRAAFVADLNQLASLSPEGRLLLEILEELREVKSAQRRIVDVLAAWDALGLPSTRIDGR